MNQALFDRCPFREKTASRRLYLTLARSATPLSKSEIAKSAHLTVARTALLLAAYVNPLHRAPMDRVGVRLVRTKDGSFTLQACKPKPMAKRPARGETNKKPVKKAKSNAARSPSAFCSPAKSRSKPQIPHPDQPVERSIAPETEIGSPSESPN